MSDCSDGSDEENCATNPRSRRFECQDGNGCVRLNQLCDCDSTTTDRNCGNANCADLSDESLDMCSGKTSV